MNLLHPPASTFPVKDAPIPFLEFDGFSSLECWHLIQSPEREYTSADQIKSGVGGSYSPFVLSNPHSSDICQDNSDKFTLNSLLMIFYSLICLR